MAVCIFFFFFFFVLTDPAVTWEGIRSMCDKILLWGYSLISFVEDSCFLGLPSLSVWITS